MLEINGEIDMLTGPPMESEVRRLLASDAVFVVLDMCGVTFIEVSGLAARDPGRRGGGQARQAVAPADPSREVQRVLAKGGLADVVDDVGAA